MKVVIIGGVAGGMACAARLRRLDEQATIVVFEKGPDFSFSNCGLPYFIGGEFEDRGGLLIVKQPVLAARFRLDLRSMTEVTAIDRANKKVAFRNVATGANGEESYDKLVIATGASPIVPPLPGLPHPKILTLRNLPDMDRIISCVHEGAKAVVVGGGFVGIEVAEALVHRKCHVELVELLDQILAPMDPEMVGPLQRELTMNGITLRLKTGAKGFRAVGEKITIDIGTGLIEDVDFVILAIGVRPDSQLATASGLQVTPRGYIVTDEHMATSDPNIYAVGDAVQVQDWVLRQPTVLPLAGPAARQGRVAAENMAGQRSAFRGVQGTAIIRVFKYTAGCTGLNVKTLTRANRPHSFVYAHPMNHVAFMPGKAALHVKLVFDPTTAAFLGAQVIGRGEGVDSRVNAFAMALQANMTVHAMAEAELCYAPPYSSPKDPVNIAAMIASGVVRGEQVFTNWDKIQPTDLVLDVRQPPEIAAGPVNVGQVLCIPLEQLRGRLAELPRDRKIHITCQAGQRAYYALCILRQSGFAADKLVNIGGGYLTMLMSQGRPMPAQQGVPAGPCGAPAAKPTGAAKPAGCCG